MSTPGTHQVGPRRSLFDLWSRVYDLAPVQWAIYRPVQEAVLRELRRPPAHRILDVGCGTGILTERLARELDAELVCGCDFSIGMLDQAVARRSGPWVQSDAQQLPVAGGTVDVVVSTESFHWFPDPDARAGGVPPGAGSQRPAAGGCGQHARGHRCPAPPALSLPGSVNPHNGPRERR